MPRDAVSRTTNVERTGRHKWVNAMRGVAFKLIKSYFSNIKQYVNYNETKSDLLTKKLKVVSGSKCAPLIIF